MSDLINLESCRHIYFLGIGGIGMSALARYLNYKGIQISGYDRDRTELTKKLEAEGMTIHYQDDIDMIPTDIDIVIYTPAIPKDQGEFVHLGSSDIVMLKRSEALKSLLSTKKVIAVAGTHGKTSTSAMIAHVLHSQGVAISAFIGGILKNYDSNFIYGDSDWVVIEADEYDRSFLRLFPDLAVVQAMDADHLDIYGDKDHIVESFRDFTLQIKPEGKLWVRSKISEFWSDENWKEALDQNQVQLSAFDFRDQSAAIFSDDLVQANGHTSFDLCSDDQRVRCELQMPGLHNVVNATGAAAIALQMGLSLDQIAKGLASFEGIQRRFEFVHRNDDLVIIDDYAHHPVEINAAISATRSHFPNKKLTVVFQPHLFTRTRDFQDDFAHALDQADQVYLLDIYPARELPIEGVTSESILSRMQLKLKEKLSKEEIVQRLDKDQIEVLLILGAGDINKLIPIIKDKLT